MTLKEKAYQTIRERILDGIYEPGQMLNEKSITEELQISRTPFREAINLLERDGLITIKPNHGFYVHELSVQDMMEIFDVRFLLEPTVARLAASRMDERVAQQLRSRTSQALDGTISDMLREDNYFHMTVLHSISNAYLIRCMEDVYTYFRISNYGDKRLFSLEPSLREHLQILDALAAHDPDRAEEATRRHLMESRKRAAGLVF